MSTALCIGIAYLVVGFGLATYEVACDGGGRGDDPDWITVYLIGLFVIVVLCWPFMLIGRMRGG